MVGFANVYALHSPSEQGQLWDRMQNGLEPSIPWIIGVDFNFVERRQDKKGA